MIDKAQRVTGISTVSMWSFINAPPWGKETDFCRYRTQLSASWSWVLQLPKKTYASRSLVWTFTYLVTKLLQL